MKEFKLSDAQEASAKKFEQKHSKCAKKLPTATDGKYPITYTFTPGGIGTIAKVVCNGCGKELDITEYENW